MLQQTFFLLLNVSFPPCFLSSSLSLSLFPFFLLSFLFLGGRAPGAPPPESAPGHKNFSPPNPFAQGSFTHWSCSHRVRSPLLNMYVIMAYYGLSYVMCDAKNTEGALAEISSNFLDNIQN